MKMIRKLDRTGDSVIEFDETEATATQRAEAKKVFDDWIAKKRAAFLTKRPAGAPDMKIKRFDQIEDAAEVILVPTIVAG